MDSTGWHASIRAQRVNSFSTTGLSTHSHVFVLQNSSLYSTPQRGPDGQYEGVEQAQPLADGSSSQFALMTRYIDPSVIHQV